MADENKPKTGDVVTVITSGEHNLFDPNTGVNIMALTPTKVTMNRFIEEQISFGNLKLTSDESAPEAREGVEEVDEVRRTDLAQPALENEQETQIATVKDNTEATESEPATDAFTSSDETSTGRKGRSRSGA